MADVVRLTSGNLYKYSYFQVIIFCYWKQNKEKKMPETQTKRQIVFQEIGGLEGVDKN